MCFCFPFVFFMPGVNSIFCSCYCGILAMYLLSTMNKKKSTPATPIIITPPTTSTPTTSTPTTPTPITPTPTTPSTPTTPEPACPKCSCSSPTVWPFSGCDVTCGAKCGDTCCYM